MQQSPRIRYYYAYVSGRQPSVGEYLDVYLGVGHNSLLVILKNVIYSFIAIITAIAITAPSLFSNCRCFEFCFECTDRNALPPSKFPKSVMFNEFE